MNQELFNEIEREGYAVLKNIIDPNLIRECEQLAKKDWDVHPDDFIIQKNRQNKFLVMPKLINVLMHEKIDSMCRMFLGDEYRYDHLVFMRGEVKRGKIKKTGTIYDIEDLHGGPFSNGGTNFYLDNMPMDKPFPRTGRLNIGIPFTPCNAKIGGPQILPRTHLDKDLVTYGHPKGLGGVSEEWIEKWRSKGNEIVIPSLAIGDVFIFIDSLVHGTSKHTRQRMTCYAMACPSFVQLTHWEISGKKYLEHCTTEEQKSRFWHPFWFDINTQTHKATNRKKMFLSKGL